MNLASAITYLHPNAIPTHDFVVRDDSDGRGQYIDEWNLSDPQPTQDQLQTAWIGYLKKDKIVELTEACDKAIAQGFTATNGHTYQYQTNDQANINKQLTLLLLNDTITDVLWKTVDAGAINHTRDEFIALATDASNHERNNIGKLWQLEAQVNSAIDEDSINLVVW
jgi:hypothetical protein